MSLSPTQLAVWREWAETMVEREPSAAKNAAVLRVQYHDARIILALLDELESVTKQANQNAPAWPIVARLVAELRAAESRMTELRRTLAKHNDANVAVRCYTKGVLDGFEVMTAALLGRVRTELDSAKT